MKNLKFSLLALVSMVLMLSACKNDNSKEPEPGPTPIPIGEKCKASDYPQVTIGTQIWMAENYRCSKYDTESEAYKNGMYLVPTSEDGVFTPYYTDASDKSKWRSYGMSLTDKQIKKLGYIYNWAAAVGVAEDGRHQTSKFIGNRQGICPNGWHVPSRAEWQTLYDYIYKDKSLSSNTVGKYLKTTSGWHQGVNGLNSYGFAVLPAGYANESGVVGYVGSNAEFWTADTEHGLSPSFYGRDAYFITFSDQTDDLKITYYTKIYGRSVRCLRD